jgi:hypothetical protein
MKYTNREEIVLVWKIRARQEKTVIAPQARRERTGGRFSS